MKVAAAQLAKPLLELLVMFEDEARFGRMSRPMRCWAPGQVNRRATDHCACLHTIGIKQQRRLAGPKKMEATSRPASNVLDASDTRQRV
jgi:hypothetical protein